MSILNYFSSSRNKPLLNAAIREDCKWSAEEARFVNDAFANTTPARKGSKTAKKRCGNRYDFKARIRIANYARFHNAHAAARKYNVSPQTADKYMKLLVEYLGRHPQVNQQMVNFYHYKWYVEVWTFA